MSTAVGIIGDVKFIATGLQPIAASFRFAFALYSCHRTRLSPSYSNGVGYFKHDVPTSGAYYV